MTKSIVVISGKGGTGKTSLTAAFALLTKRVVVADCDVDAADLHLLLGPAVEREERFVSGERAAIDPDRCTACGACREACAFGAIDERFAVDPIACEGCGVCRIVCPADAVTMHPAECGRWFQSRTRVGPMLHARLDPGRENSGRLVSLVRGEATRVAEESNAALILTDGPPGIGCPVIAAITGNDLVLVVTEPTPAGCHDLERVAELAAHFGIAAGVILNKADISEEWADSVERLCAERGMPLFGRLPYTTDFVQAQLAEKTIVEYSDGPVARELRAIWGRALRAAGIQE